MTELYALTGQMAELAALADTDDEGLRQAIQDTMDGIKGEFEVKAESIVMLRRNIEGDIDAIDKEVDRLNELKRIKKNTVGHPAPEHGGRGYQNHQAPAVHHHPRPFSREGDRR